jgi:hypothetical protein
MPLIKENFDGGLEVAHEKRTKTPTTFLSLVGDIHT